MSFLICSLLLAAAAPAGEIDPEGVLRFSLGGEVSVLNPILSTDTVSSAVEGVIFTGMVTFNESLEPVPDLAKSWDVSSDGKIWTFHLRRDVKWHDGVPLTADDVVFTFNSILDPKVNSVRRSDYIIDGQPIRFKAVDKYTVQAILPKPFAPFLIHAAMSIIPKHLLAGKDINTAAFNRKPVGTGPFIFKEWQTGDHVTVVRNPNYYLGKPLLKEIIYKIIPDENSALVALEAGEIDEAGIPPKDYTRMKAVKGINVYESDVLLYTYLGFNLANPKFTDKRVRQALAYATDKKQLVNLILRGLGTPAYAPSAPISWAYSDRVPKYQYDPEKAKKLLKEAGVKDLEFTILVNQGNKEREKAAVILQQQYKKIGVKVKIRVMEWSAILKIVNANKDPKDFEAVIMGWSLGLDPDGYSIWHSSQYPQGFNFIKYKDPLVDKLLEEGRTTVDKGKRKQIYAKLWKAIAEDQPYVFLWYPKAIAGVNDRVGGLSKPGPAGLFLHIEKVYKKK
ncbi:MAG: peptide-binding protein [Candidatus Margulisbacteria bacterium]|nr:peptide-binding protein [Candidatus Margulisiibacteriota bacterium]